MDPVTHAASGAVALLCLPQRPMTGWAPWLAALACASPDIDVFFSSTPLGFLEFHRGITHSFAAAPLFGFLLALGCYPLWRSTTPGHWRLSEVWLLCVAMILLHDWLDVVTSYGTMVFLPFSHYRVRLNAIFIVDLLVTLPLLWALWRWRNRRRFLLAVLAWTFLYPAMGIALNQWHTDQWQQRLAHSARQCIVYPDAFAPFFWRVNYTTMSPARPEVAIQSIDALGRARGAPETFPAADPHLVGQLMASSVDAKAYFAFAQLPIMVPGREEDAPPSATSDAVSWMFYDLRFGSGLDWVRRLMQLRPNADTPFQLMAQFSSQEGAPAVEQIRLRFTDSGRDSHWHTPVVPGPPTIAQWLLGKY